MRTHFHPMSSAEIIEEKINNDQAALFKSGTAITYLKIQNTKIIPEDEILNDKIF